MRVAGFAAKMMYQDVEGDVDHHQHCMEATAVAEIQPAAGIAAQGCRAVEVGSSEEEDEKPELAAGKVERDEIAAAGDGSIIPEHPAARKEGECRPLMGRSESVVGSAAAEQR